MEQPYMLPILYCQYRAHWCPGDLSHQGISRHGIDQIRWNISSLSSEGLIHVAFLLKLKLQLLLNSKDYCYCDVLSQMWWFIYIHVIPPIQYISAGLNSLALRIG